MAFNDGNSLISEPWENLCELQVRGYSPGSPEGSLDPGPAVAVVCCDLIGRLLDRPAPSDVEIRRNIRRGPDAEERVESNIHRTPGKRLIVAVLPEPQMPFSYHCSVVALVLQERSNGDLPFLNRGLPAPGGRVGSKGISTREKTVSGKVTQGARGMSVGKADSLPTELVEVGSGNLRARIISAQVPVSHVVHEDNQDVWEPAL